MTVHRCPDCRCATDEQPAQPSTSSEWARRQAIEASAAAVRKAKEARGRQRGVDGLGQGFCTPGCDSPCEMDHR